MCGWILMWEKTADGLCSIQNLKFWRHPFTAEDPSVSKWCNATFLKICFHEETPNIALVTGGSTLCSSSSIINEFVNYMNVWYWHLHHHEGVAHETSRSSNMTGMNTPSCWVGRLRSHEGKSYSMNPVVCCYCYTSEPVQNWFMLMRPYVPTNTMKLKLCVMTNGA